jgi:hypothetical protein
MIPIRHDAVLATVTAAPAQLRRLEAQITEFREGLPASWRPLIHGPVASVAGRFATYAFLADGAAKDRPADLDGEAYREVFVDLFARQPDTAIVQISYGVGAHSASGEARAVLRGAVNTEPAGAIADRIHANTESADDAARDKAKRTFSGRLFLWFLDRACLHTTQLCLAYGGPGPNGSSRLCDKHRWHYDSHAYGRHQMPDGAIAEAGQR